MYPNWPNTSRENLESNRIQLLAIHRRLNQLNQWVSRNRDFFLQFFGKIIFVDFEN